MIAGGNVLIHHIGDPLAQGIIDGDLHERVLSLRGERNGDAFYEGNKVDLCCLTAF